MQSCESLIFHMACALFGFLSFVLRMDRALKDLEDKQNSKKESVRSLVHFSQIFFDLIGVLDQRSQDHLCDFSITNMFTNKSCEENTMYISCSFRPLAAEPCFPFSFLTS
jgi:hypothetical protein